MIARVWRATRLAIRPVDRIRSSDLTELRDEWLKARAPATVVRRMAFLSHVYTVIRKDWGFDQLANPVQLVRRPAVDDARDRRLFDRITLRGVSDDDCPRKELEWIIRATRSTELPTILTVAKETGMRRSEVVGIQREHLDLMDQHLAYGGRGIPRLVIYDENGAVIDRWGPRPQPAQAKVLAYKALEEKPPYSELVIELQKWYAKDRTKTLQSELVEIMSKLK